MTTPIPTTAPHDVKVALVQRPGPVTPNMLNRLAGACRGYATGPCRGRVGRVVLEGLPATLGLRPRALEAELQRVLEHVAAELAPVGAQVSLELGGEHPAILVQPLQAQA